MTVTASSIATALRRGAQVSDPLFDLIYPAAHRRRSMMHWTPVGVAIRACALLAPVETTRVLDVGSGVGKLCLVGALTTRASWFGIETNAQMVQVAGAAAATLGVGRSASFGHGDVTSVDWSEFDAFYLFNPFAEQLLHGEDDDDTRRATYDAYIHATQQRLGIAEPGTRVVTYHGFGGELPVGYDRVHRERAHEDELELWIRRRPRWGRAEATA